VEFFGFSEKYGEAMADGSILVPTSFRYKKARDIPLVFVSYVSTWSYVGIKRILVEPNRLRYRINLWIFWKNFLGGFFLIF
jgi:hypothetical protein